MEANLNFFRDLAYVFLGATAGGLLAWRLRQPVILGYVLAGILISPLTPGPAVSDVHSLELMAEVGVVLLMFSVGLEFNVKDLLRAKWVALVGGTTGILLSIGLGLAAGKWMGWNATQGIVVGSIISVASTMVLTRLLMDRGELQTEHGLVMVSITLVEDLAVVVLVVLMPSFGSLEVSRVLAIAQGLGKAALILVPTLLVAAKVVPPLLARAARTRSQELFFLVVLAVCLGTAALTQAVGLSVALGAFVAGLIISGSEFAHETLAELFPLRDAFVALFFVTIGLLVHPRELFSNLPLLAVMLGLILAGKFVVWLLVVRLFRYPIWTALLVAAGLTQIGEFSFILVKVARNSNLVASDIYNATLAASLISILLNAALVRAVSGWVATARHTKAAGSIQAYAPETRRDHVILCGFGRVGSSIGTAFETFKLPFVVVESDPLIIEDLRTRGVPCFYGHARHPHLLKHAGIERCSLVVVTLGAADQAELAAQTARALNSMVPILARAHNRHNAERLRQAGVNRVIQPELEASAALIREALQYLKLPENRASVYLEGLREAVAEGQMSIATDTYPEVRRMQVDGSNMEGRALHETRIRERFGVSVVFIGRATGEIVINPSGETLLREGDEMRVFGLPKQIDSLAKYMTERVVPEGR
jgi:K+:H+ antiporter